MFKDLNPEIHNPIGRLQELCQKSYESYPNYQDISDGNTFKFKCSLKDWVTEGTGSNKKTAKYMAAQNMLVIFEEQHYKKFLEKKVDNIHNKSAISKLMEYSAKEKKEAPEFYELPLHEGYYYYQCMFEGVQALAKSKSKKNAKEKAADEIVIRLGINEYFNKLQKSKAPAEV